MRALVLLAPALLACRNEGSLLLPQPDVTLTVDSPTYGQFLGDEAAVVTGTVSPPEATLLVEGREIEVDADGRFEAEVLPEHGYRIIDVEASLREEYERVRVPVFRGRDPLETWPGGITLRLTPSGMTRLGQGLGATIDATGWDQQVLAAIPPLTTNNFSLTATGLAHDPTVVALRPATEGVDVAVTFQDIAIELLGEIPIGQGQPFTIPITVGYQEVALGLHATPVVDPQGMLSLSLTAGDLVLDQPEITIFGLDGWLLELVMLGVGFVIEPLGETLFDVVLDQLGTIELGGPYVFDQDLLGTAIQVRLSDVFGDPDGLGAGLGVGLGEPAIVGPLPIPAPVDDRVDVHASLGLHEGLMQLIVTGGALDLLTQDISLPGFLGEIIGTAARNLPGGDEAPEGDGWCLSLDPGTARVVRLQEGIDPLAVLHMPDVKVDIGVMDGSTCETWLLASLAFEIGFQVVDGTQLVMALGVPEGAVVEYGTTEAYDEAEVVAGLGAFMQTAMGLLGGQLSFDLADLLGGVGGQTGDPILDAALGDLSPKFVDSQPMLDVDGQPVEGLYSVSLSLWE